MPITTNKPVNFISFSIVLLVIMGLCICIAPDTAYAVDQEPALPPADAFAPALQLAFPQPPESDFQGWVAVSNGTQARVFILSYLPGSSVVSQHPHVVLEDVLTSSKKIEMAYYGLSGSELIISRWDSDVPAYSLVGRHQFPGAAASVAYTYDTWITPTYIAFGGCVALGDSTELKSFVPIFSDNGYDELLKLETEAAAIADSLVKLRANVGLITDDVDTLRQQTKTNLDAILAALGTENNETQAVLEALRSETDTSLQALRANIGLIKDDVDTLRAQTKANLDEIRLDVDTIRAQTDAHLTEIQADVDTIRAQTKANLDAILSSVGNIETDMGSMLEIIQGFEDNFDSLTQAMTSLESSFSSIADQLSVLSDEMAELTAAIEAETEIWENSKTEYKYDQVDDHSVSAFGKLWDWLINPFMSLFASSAPNGEISYDVESLDPESLVTQQLSVGQYFQDVFFNPDTVDPSYPDLGDIDFGGLP